MSAIAERTVAKTLPARRVWVPEGSGATRMYCFHPAGGAASFYRGWSKTYLPGIATRAVQLPGREARLSEKPHRSVREAAVEIVDGLDRELGERPNSGDCFFGYSLGTLVAFETIREMRRRGWELPGRLIVSAMAAPQDMHAVQQGMSSRRSDNEILDEIRRSKSVPDFILNDRTVMQAVLPTIRSDFELVENYRAEVEAPLPIPIIAYGGLSDPYVQPCHVSSWAAETTASFRLRFFAGDHYFLKQSATEIFQDLSDVVYPKRRMAA
jgi:medium-chain acyl-[acyl-carrier-protein] hydrolase